MVPDVEASFGLINLGVECPGCQWDRIVVRSDGEGIDICNSHRSVILREAVDQVDRVKPGWEEIIHRTCARNPGDLAGFRLGDRLIRSIDSENNRTVVHRDGPVDEFNEHVLVREGADIPFDGQDARDGRT